MNKNEITALLAQELVDRSPKLKPMYANSKGIVVFDSQDPSQAGEVLMKAPAFFRAVNFCNAVKVVAQRTNQKFNRLGLTYFQKELDFENIVKFYANEENSILSFKDSYKIKKFFIDKSGCSLRDLARKIDNPAIPRTLLIDLVEALEYLTGRPLSSADSQPLAYLDEEATFNDIAEYFSAGNEKISDVRARVLKALPPTKEQLVERFKTKAAVIYAQIVGKDFNEAFLAHRVKELHPVGFGPQEWDLAIAWTEDELNIQVFQTLSEEITDESTVRDLLELFCKKYAESLK